VTSSAHWWTSCRRYADGHERPQPPGWSTWQQALLAASSTARRSLSALKGPRPPTGSPLIVPTEGWGLSRLAAAPSQCLLAGPANMYTAAGRLANQCSSCYTNGHRGKGHAVPCVWGVGWGATSLPSAWTGPWAIGCRQLSGGHVQWLAPDPPVWPERGSCIRAPDALWPTSLAATNTVPLGVAAAEHAQDRTVVLESQTQVVGGVSNGCICSCC